VKSLIVTASFVLVLGVNVPCSSAEETPTAPVSAESAAELRKGVEDLGKMFGVEAPEPATAPKSEPVAPTKSVADVMDKAIDKISNVVGSMAKALDDVAPEIWRIMMKQQYAKAVMNCVVPLGVLIVIYFYVSIVGKVWNPPGPEEGRSSSEEWDARMAFVRVGPTVLACVSGLWFFNRFADSIAYLINPEFYAIQDLLRMILNKGM
jgi:hypothetical protein